MNNNVRYYIGFVLIGYSILCSVIALASIILGEEYWIYYALSALVLITLGYLLKKGIVPSQISILDSIVIAIASFLIPIVYNSIIMVLMGFSIWDSIFESTSSITTTGLTLYGVNEIPYTLHFSRSIHQWVGGLGIVVLTLSFFIRPGTTAYRLLVIHIHKESTMPSLARVAKVVIQVYMALTILMASIYYLFGMNLFDSIVHAFTTISTGGFSTYDYIPGRVVLPAIVLMFISAQSFTYYHYIFVERKVRIPLQTILFTLLNIISIAIMMSIAAVDNVRIDASGIVFTVLSASTTTGYSVVSLDNLPDSFLYILSILMIIGASMGSTGGGLKQYRLLVIVKELKRRLVKIANPSLQVSSIKIADSIVGEEEISGIFTVFTLFLITVTLSTMALLVAGYSLVDSLFVSSSAVGTVGLATSIVSKTMPDWIKLVLSIDMFLGRLEIVTVVAPIAYIGELLRHKIKIIG